jgi:hypothetical protein
MPLIEGAGVEAVLEQVADAMSARVEIEGEAAVGAAQGGGKRLRLVRGGDQVDVVAHQAVSENACAGLDSIGGEAFEVGAAVRVSEKHALMVNPALGDVVRQSHGNGASESWHMLRVWRAVRISHFVP